MVILDDATKVEVQSRHPRFPEVWSHKSTIDFSPDAPPELLYVDIAWGGPEVGLVGLTKDGKLQKINAKTIR